MEELKPTTNEGSRKKSSNNGCLIVFGIILFAFLSIFVKPLFKSYMHYKAQERADETGILGAGLDRARFIIDEIDKLSPFSLEMLGEIRKTHFGMGMIIMEFEFSDIQNPLGLDLDYVYKNEDAAKEFIMTEIQGMPEGLRKVMSDIAKEQFSLSVGLSLTSGSKSANIRLEPHEIENALKRNTDIDTKTMSLMLISKAENMLLPVKVDQLTNWTGSQLSNSSFVYVYEVDDSAIDLNTIDRVKLKEQMISLYAHPQKPMERQIDLCINTGRSIGYKYIGTQTNNSFIIELSSSELQRLLQK